MMRRHLPGLRSSGFTLIELVTILILIGILAVTVVPRFFTKDSFAARAVQTQVIGKLRLLQLQAMNQRSGCRRFIVTSSHFGLADCDAPPVGEEAVPLEDVSIKIGSDATPDVRFDRQGRPQGATGDCHNGSNQGGCTLTLTLEETVSIKIESEGYIHAL